MEKKNFGDEKWTKKDYLKTEAWQEVQEKLAWTIGKVFKFILESTKFTHTRVHLTTTYSELRFSDGGLLQIFKFRHLKPDPEHETVAFATLHCENTQKPRYCCLFWHGVRILGAQKWPGARDCRHFSDFL